MRSDLVIPWRGGSNVPPLPTIAPGNLLAQLRGVLPKIKSAVASHRGTASSEALARMDRVYGWKSVSELDLDLAATSLALFRLIGAGLESLVKTWIGAKGFPFALEALALGVERGIVVDYDHYPSSLVDGVTPFASLTLDPGKMLFICDHALTESSKAIYALRTLAAAADAPTYASLRETGARLLQNTSTASAVAIATVLSEERELVDGVVRRLIGEEAPPGSTMMLASVRDLDLARALVQKHIVYVDDEDVGAWTLIARLGRDAGAVLAAGARDAKADHLLPFLEAVESPESYRALLPFASSKKHTSRVQKVFLAHPETAVLALAPVLADPKHKQLAAAKVIAAAITKAHPNLLAKTQRAKNPQSIAKNLPPLLASPPWLAPVKKSAATEPIQLTPMIVALRSDKRAGDLDALAKYAKWGDEVGAYYLSKHKSKLTREHWIKSALDDEKHGRAVDLDLMLLGPEELALEKWNGVSDHRRLYYPNRYYGGAFLVALERRGAAFMPGLLKLLQLRPAGASRMPVEEIALVLLTFDGSAIAEVCVQHFDSGKKFKAFAEAWARRYPETSAKTAIAHAVSGGKLASNAIAFLQSLVASGAAGIQAIRDVAKAYERASGKPVSTAIDALVGTDPLRFFPAKLPKLPDVVDASSLPPIMSKNGGALPDEAIAHVGMMLAMSAPDAPYAGVAVLREACTAESLRDFSWALFEAWLATGSSPKEMWILHALGFLGDDETARRLAPMLRAWPGERAAARAVQGLAVLANIGSDLALMLLDGIAEKVRFASIQLAARERIEQIAKARGLTRDELADRLVPDLGLDARGERTLDFGARTFRVGFDEHLEPWIVDAAGKRLAALPKPSKSDDAAKAKSAQADFKALKKDIATIAHSRIDRLETAMIARRRWKAEDMRAFFIDKPVVLHLARRLVWAAYDGDARIATFRVDAERSLSDSADKAFTLQSAFAVGVVHVIDLDANELATWSRIFADYEILQPFAQLAREVLRATPDSQHGVEMPAPKLVFGLEKLRWQRWSASDGGSFSGHSKIFAGTPFTAHVRYSGAVGMGYIEDKEMLTIEEVTFTRDGGEALKVGDVDAIIVSEVLHDLKALQT